MSENDTAWIDDEPAPAHRLPICPRKPSQDVDCGVTLRSASAERATPRHFHSLDPIEPVFDPYANCKT